VIWLAMPRRSQGKKEYRAIAMIGCFIC